jgi:thiamine pyrophosphate-dependent acetolactate synthase large subunit-like protein
MASSRSLDARWIERLVSRRSEAISKRERDTGAAGASIAPAQFARTLDRALPRGAITVLDGNLVMRECQRHMPVHEPVCRLTPGNNGCLGVGIPYAIGAKLACPERPVVAICGDFAFGLSAFEMETAVRHRIPIVVIVANNDGNAGAMSQRDMFPDGHPDRVSMYEPRLRYAELMRVFGGHAEQVDDIEELGPALARALAADGPACINVALDPNAPFPRD